MGASWAGTALFAATAGLATVSAAADLVAVVVALGLFAAGGAVFVVAFARGVRRSRHEQIVVGSLFLLQTSAPPAVRRALLGSLGVEVVVGFVTAAIRPNTSLAFGILVPLYGLALTGLWGAYHGRFPARAGDARAPGGPRGPASRPQG